MIISVRHTTVYRYAEPMRGVIQSLRLFPSETATQRVIAWQVDVPGTLSGSEFTDGAGDFHRTVAVRGAVNELSIHVEGEVETEDAAGVLKGHAETVRPEVYMRATQATKPDRALTELVREALATAEDSLLARAHLLSHAVGEAITYTSGATQSQTTAAEALSLGQGVCQDHAHALIGAAHTAGMPARYVAGYLLSGDGMAPEEASHAWAEIWIEGLGWIGFDAANACCPDDRYVRVCSGFDAQDAAPIRGIASGGAVEDMQVDVAVIRAGQ